MNRLFAVVILGTLMLFPTEVLFAHCDTMNGPVVTAARKALDAENVDLVLIWVQKEDEGQIKEAFQKTVAVRKLSPEAKDLADMYFFETVVRVHRAGEGVAYTGLKGGETEVHPGIEAADHALEEGSAAALLEHVTSTIRQGVMGQ